MTKDERSGKYGIDAKISLNIPKLKLYIWEELYSGSFAGDVTVVLAPDLRTAKKLAIQELIANGCFRPNQKEIPNPDVVISKPGAFTYNWSE